jgi:H+/gluconate symporter-like permease
MLAPCRRFPCRTKRKSILIPLAAVAAVLALSSCSSDAPPEPPPIEISTEPIGSGLKLIGYALLGAAVVTVIGRLIR